MRKYFIFFILSIFLILLEDSSTQELTVARRPNGASAVVLPPGGALLNDRIHLLQQPSRPVGSMDYAFPGNSPMPETTSPSRSKAFLRSFLIPGWGQKYAGAKTSARNFFVAELALWTGFIAFQVRGHWLEDDYRLFGTTHAGLDPDGKNDRYFVDVGNFNSIDEYNQAKLRERDVAALYDPANFYWKWDNDANRQRFDDLRVRSEQAYSNSSLVIVGVLANHVISGIHAAYLARRREHSHRQGALPSPRFYVESSPRDIRLVARLPF